MSSKSAGRKARHGAPARPNKESAPARADTPPPAKPRRRRPRLTDERADAFIEHLARTGSVTVAAEQAGIGRTQIYEHRRTHKRFAAAWTKALALGVERLHDDAMRRALEGDERPIVRKGELIGTERRFDNRLLQFLLKVHKPEFAGGAPTASESEQEAMAKRLKAAAKRLEAHRARQSSASQSSASKAGKKKDGDS